MVNALGADTALEGWTLHTRAAHVVEDAMEESQELAAEAVRVGVRALACVRIGVEDAIWGALTVGWEAAGAATRDRVAFLEALAGHLRLAIRNASLYAELRGAHEELKRAQFQVVQQERLHALGEMASGIAHDFNNALAPLLGFSELLLLNPEVRDDRAALQRYLELIHTGARDAASVVRRLREFYRRREPDEPLQAVELDRLVPQVAGLTRPRWKDARSIWIPRCSRCRRWRATRWTCAKR